MTLIIDSSCKHVREMYTPYTPLLYSETGVYRGIHYFLIFVLKHRLWVPTIYVLIKNMKKVKNIQTKIVIFTAVKNRCMLHGRVFVMYKFACFNSHKLGYVNICLEGTSNESQ